MQTDNMWTFSAEKPTQQDTFDSFIDQENTADELVWIRVVCDVEQGQRWFDESVGFGDDALDLQNEIYAFLERWPSSVISIKAQEE